MHFVRSPCVQLDEDGNHIQMLYLPRYSSIAQRIAKERSMQILTSQPLVNRVNVPSAAYAYL